MASKKQKALDGQYERRVKKDYARPSKQPNQPDLKSMFEEALTSGNSEALENEYERRGWDAEEARGDLKMESDRRNRSNPAPLIPDVKSSTDAATKVQRLEGVASEPGLEIPDERGLFSKKKPKQ
jgi:hypothetical protein